MRLITPPSSGSPTRRPRSTAIDVGLDDEVAGGAHLLQRREVVDRGGPHPEWLAVDRRRPGPRLHVQAATPITTVAIADEWDRRDGGGPG